MLRNFKDPGAAPLQRKQPQPATGASETPNGYSTLGQDDCVEQQAHHQTAASVRGNQHSRRRFLAAFFGLGTSVWTASQRSGYPSDEGQEQIRRLGYAAWRKSIERKDVA